MEQTVLVAYATRLGSTRQTAEFIAKELRKCGLDAELAAMADVTSLEKYGAVVMTAALYMGRLHRDARRFLEQHRTALAQRPVALFVPGPVDQTPKAWEGARAQVEQAMAKRGWLHPVACHVIGGAWDPDAMSYPWKLLLHRLPKSDARDWDAIRDLVCQLAPLLQPQLAAH